MTPLEAHCPSCGALFEPGSRFCGICGAKVVAPPPRATCARCGAPLDAGARFCGACGATVTTAAPARSVAVPPPPAPDETAIAAVAPTLPPQPELADILPPPPIEDTLPPVPPEDDLLPLAPPVEDTLPSAPAEESLLPPLGEEALPPAPPEAGVLPSAPPVEHVPLSAPLPENFPPSLPPIEGILPSATPSEELEGDTLPSSPPGEVRSALPLPAPQECSPLFTGLPVSQFLDRLASAEPTPGGGSTAALAGALGAALVSMVANLTFGKKGYEAVQEELVTLLAQAEGLRAELPQLLERDTQVYAQVMTAYRWPRKTAEERTFRQEAIQSALKAATDTPLRIAECCAQALPLALRVAELGNAWAVSDAGVGALLAEAAARGALLNVEVNLASLADADYVATARARAAAVLESLSSATERVMAVVGARMVAG